MAEDAAFRTMGAAVRQGRTGACWAMATTMRAESSKHIAECKAALRGYWPAGGWRWAAMVLLAAQGDAVRLALWDSIVVFIDYGLRTTGTVWGWL